MEIISLFPPSAGTPDHIALAAELGYQRAWVCDVPVSVAGTGITRAQPRA